MADIAIIDGHVKALRDFISRQEMNNLRITFS